MLQELPAAAIAFRYELMGQSIYDYAASPSCRRHCWAARVECGARAALVRRGGRSRRRQDRPYVCNLAVLCDSPYEFAQHDSGHDEHSIVSCDQLLYMALAYALLRVARLVRTLLT